MSDESLEAYNEFDYQNHCDLIIEQDLHGNVLYADGGVEKFYGYRPEEIVGRNVLEFCTKEEVGWRGNNLKALFHKRQSYRIPYFRAKHKNGNFLDCECTASPFYDDLGELVGYKQICWMKH